jgi:hypothetical protein
MHIYINLKNELFLHKVEYLYLKNLLIYAYLYKFEK